MGKYASGTSMKTVIESEVNEVTAILDKSNLTQEDKSAVINALKEMAYQWCSSNATACAVENAVTEAFGKDGLAVVSALSMRNGTREVKLLQTYPY